MANTLPGLTVAATPLAVIGGCLRKHSFSIDPEAAHVEASSPAWEDQSACLFAPEGALCEVGQVGWDGRIHKF